MSSGNRRSAIKRHLISIGIMLRAPALFFLFSFLFFPEVANWTGVETDYFNTLKHLSI